MKKIILISLVAILSTLLIWKLYSKTTKNNFSTNYSLVEDEKEDEEKEDGIKEAQKHEFEITQDIALGYVPLNRLIKSAESLMARRKVLSSSRETGLNLTWVERGPDSDVTGPSNGNTRTGNAKTAGRVRAMWFDLADNTNQTLWVGGVAGGVWKTTNIGSPNATWTPVNDYFANMAIAGITQDPTKNNIMYFGTGENTYNADAVRGGGVFKSTDHGVNWELLPGTEKFYNVSKILCDQLGNVYVSTVGNGYGLMRSKDKGATWSNIAPGGLSSSVSEMVISNLGRMHVVCGYYNSSPSISGYRYTDRPDTVSSAFWQSPITSFPNPQYHTAITVTDSTLYVLPANIAFQTPFIYKSVDGGKNWAKTAGDPGSTISSGQAWYNLAIALDPKHPDTLIAGGLNTFRSTNGGTTWTQISDWVGVTSRSYIHADQQYALWNGDQVVMASDGGIHYSSDGGATFKDRNLGLRIKQFYSVEMHPTQTNYFLAGAQDNGVHQLNQPGISTSVEVTGGDGGLVRIDQDEPQFQFGSYVFNAYRKSTNGGATWSAVNFGTNLGQFINPFDYDNAGNKIYAGAATNQYLRWNDPQTGSNYTLVALAALNGTVRHVSVSPYTSNRVFFGSSSGRIVKADFADILPTGTNIAAEGMPATSVSCVAIGTTDDNLLATYSNYGQKHVWLTTSGGSDGWIDVSGNLPDIPVRWAIFYPESNSKAIIATEMGVFETDNLNGSSTNWVQNSTFPFVRTDMLRYRKSDGTVAAGTHGRGIFTTVIPKTIPYIRFDKLVNVLEEATADTTAGCRYFTDYKVNMLIDLPPTGDATVKISVAPGATAKEGVDFDITTNGSFASPSKELIFAENSVIPRSITIRVYDDAEVEDPESLTLKYTVSGNTNAKAAPSSLQSVVNINNNKNAPAIGVNSVDFTLGSRQYYLGDNSAGQPFDAKLKSKRNQMLYKASELTSLGVTAGSITNIAFDIEKYSSRPYKNLNIKMGISNVNYIQNGDDITPANTKVYKTLDSYSTVSGFNDFKLDKPFIWDGVSNVVVEICYENDDADASQLVDKTLGYADGGSSIQANLIWQDNITCGDNFDENNVDSYASGIKPRIRLSVIAGGNPIATTGSRTEYVASEGTFYFYTGKNILNQLTGATAKLGCVSSSILVSGNNWEEYSGGTRSHKVFDISPSQNQDASYTVGLYYTKEELDGREPSTLKIAKSNAADIGNAGDADNTVIGTTTFKAYGDGVLFTANFTGFSKFFLVDANVTLPVTITSFTGTLNNGNAILKWKTSSESNSSYFEVQKSPNGNNNFEAIGKVNAAGKSSTAKDYTLTDTKLAELNYYRLKSVDLDGKYAYSNTVLVRNAGTNQRIWISGNPFNNAFKINLAKAPVQSIKVELVSMNGAKVYSKEFGSATQLDINLSGSKVSNGTYIVRTIVDGTVYTNKVVKQ